MKTKVSKNLILGAAKNCTFKIVMLFIGSLRQTRYNGDVCLFISGMSLADRNTLRRYGVKIRPIRKRYPYIKDTSGLATRYPKFNFGNLSIKYHRYLMAYIYLSQHKEEYSRVMLTDTRDVVFQRDPFDFDFDETALYSFFEDKNYTINSSPCNANWIRNQFGEKALNEIGANRIVCAGVTIGTISAVINYLEKMLDCMTQLTKAFYHGDQGLHNYIIHKKLLENIKLLYSESGPVMHSLPRDQIRFNDDGFIINDKANIVNVIHQYDRIPLIKIFQDKYSIPEFSPPLYLKIYDILYNYLRKFKQKSYGVLKRIQRQ